MLLCIPEMHRLVQMVKRPNLATLGSMAILGLLASGCLPLREHTPTPIDTEESPAAPYVEELWGLAASIPREGLSPDGTHRLIVEEDFVELLHGEESVLRLGQCSREPMFDFDLDPDPAIFASWSRDSKAVLIQVGYLHTLSAHYDLDEGCGYGPSRLVFLPDPHGLWYVAPFEGRRDVALESAGSGKDFLALPALDRLGRLDAREAGVAIDYWVRADRGTREFLERAMFGGSFCYGPDSLAERISSRDGLPIELRSILLSQVLESFSRPGGSPCLEVPSMAEALTQAADSDESFARQLVDSIAGVSGFEAAMIRRRFDPPQAPLPPRPPPDRVLTEDAYLELGDEEIRWIQQALEHLPFPTTPSALRELVGIPMELLQPRHVDQRGAYHQTFRLLGPGYGLYIFYQGPDQIRMAEVFGNGNARSRRDIRIARAFASRAEALASLLEGKTIEEMTRCDRILEGLVGEQIECYRPTPHMTILLRESGQGVFGAKHRRTGRTVHSLVVEEQKYVLTTNRFPREGMRLLAETAGVQWPLLLDGDIGFGAGELRLVDSEIEVRFRGDLLARLTPDSLTLRRVDGSIDCARVRSPTSSILLRELRRDETDLCARLAAVNVAELGFEHVREAAKSEDWKIRHPGLVAWMRGYATLPPASEAMKGLSPEQAQSTIHRLCAEMMATDASRRERALTWIHELADEVEMEVPRGCF